MGTFQNIRTIRRNELWVEAAAQPDSQGRQHRPEEEGAPKCFGGRPGRAQCPRPRRPWGWRPGEEVQPTSCRRLRRASFLAPGPIENSARLSALSGMALIVRAFGAPGPGVQIPGPIKSGQMRGQEDQRTVGACAG